MYIGMEVLHRKTFTDYIDDVSTTYIDNNLFGQYLTSEQAAMANQLYFRENFVPSQPLLTRPDVMSKEATRKKTILSFLPSYVLAGD